MIRATILATILFCSCSNSSNNLDLTNSANNNNSDSLISNRIDTYFKYFNAHNWQKMADMYIDSADMKDPAYGIQSIKMSKPEIIKKYDELLMAVPDVHDDVKAIHCAKSTATVEFVSSGTGPDKKKFELPICTIFTFNEQGKIMRDHTYYDNF
jgi:SnoaL-like domain